VALGGSVTDLHLETERLELRPLTFAEPGLSWKNAGQGLPLPFLTRKRSVISVFLLSLGASRLGVAHRPVKRQRLRYSFESHGAQRLEMHSCVAGTSDGLITCQDLPGRGV
jgi:hypothetical protein